MNYKTYLVRPTKVFIKTSICHYRMSPGVATSAICVNARGSDPIAFVSAWHTSEVNMSTLYTYMYNSFFGIEWISFSQGINTCFFQIVYK